MLAESSLATGSAVDVGDAAGADRGHGGAGDDGADQVERVGGVHDDTFTRACGLADLRELLHRFGQGVLLAAEAAHEPSAAHETAVFEPSHRPLHVTPRHAQGIAHREIAEHHAPAVQQLLGHCFREVVRIDRGRAGGGLGCPSGHEGPTAGTRARGPRAASQA